MAKKRRSEYSGELNKPIVRHSMADALMVHGSTDNERDHFYRERAQNLIAARLKKFPALFTHYKIDPLAENRFVLLAYHLACRHIPGMEIVDSWQMRRRGRPRKFDRFQLLSDMEPLIAKNRGNVLEAVKICKIKHHMRYRGYAPRGLAARYYEAKSELAEARVLGQIGTKLK